MFYPRLLTMTRVTSSYLRIFLFNTPLGTMLLAPTNIQSLEIWCPVWLWWYYIEQAACFHSREKLPTAKLHQPLPASERAILITAFHQGASQQKKEFQAKGYVMVQGLSWICAAGRHKFEIIGSPVFERCCASPFKYCQYFGVNVLTRKWLKGEKRISKVSFPVQTISGVRGLRFQAARVLLSLLFHEGIDIFHFLPAQIKCLSAEFLFWQATVTTLSCWCTEVSPKCVHTQLMQCQARGSLDGYQKTVCLPLTHEGSGKAGYLNCTWFPHGLAASNGASPIHAGAAGRCQHPPWLAPTAAPAASPCAVPEALQPHAGPSQSDNASN